MKCKVGDLVKASSVKKYLRKRPYPISSSSDVKYQKVIQGKKGTIKEILNYENYTFFVIEDQGIFLKERFEKINRINLHEDLFKI